MGLMSKEMVEVINEGGTVFPILEFVIDGTTYRFSAASGVSSAQYGAYKPFIVDWSPISNGISFSGRSLQTLNCTVTIMDPDKTFHKLAAGQGYHTIRGSRVTARLVSPELTDFGQYFTFFSGIINDFGKSGVDLWTFDLGSNHKPLEGKLKIYPITQYDWPNVPSANKEKAGQVILGTHDSTGTGRNGLIPAIYVDNSGYRYVASCSPTPDLAELFVDGTATSTGWTQSSLIINGRIYRTIDFINDQSDAAITVDGDGLTINGETTAVVEDNPMRQLRMILSWYVYNEEDDVRGDLDDVSTNVPISEDKFDLAANFFDKNNVEASRVIDGDMTGLQVMGEICDSFNCFMYWDHEGNLSPGFIDWAFDDIYGSDVTINHFDHNQPGVSPKLQYGYITDTLAEEVNAEFFYDTASADFVRRLRAKDTTIDHGVTITKQMHWSRADQ